VTPPRQPRRASVQHGHRDSQRQHRGLGVRLAFDDQSPNGLGDPPLVEAESVLLAELAVIVLRALSDVVGWWRIDRLIRIRAMLTRIDNVPSRAK